MSLRARQEAETGHRVIVAIPAQNAALFSDDLRAELAACKIALIELGDVRPLWTALSVAPPEASQRAAAGNAMQDKTVVPHRRRAAWAAALVLLGAASAATYVLVRPDAAPRHAARGRQSMVGAPSPAVRLGRDPVQRARPWCRSRCLLFLQEGQARWAASCSCPADSR